MHPVQHPWLNPWVFFCSVIICKSLYKYGTISLYYSSTRLSHGREPACITGNTKQNKMTRLSHGRAIRTDHTNADGTRQLPVFHTTDSVADLFDALEQRYRTVGTAVVERTETTFKVFTAQWSKEIEVV